MRVLVAVSVLVAAFLASTGSAPGHAYLVRPDPSADATPAASPARVTLTFSEPVELIDPGDLDVVDADGRSVTAGPGRGDAAEARRISAPLAPGLPESPYTVRYTTLGADSHVTRASSASVRASSGSPSPGGSSNGGPSEAGPWGVSSRLLELAGVGGLVAAALGDAAGIAQVLGSMRFGSLVQLRGALLFGVFALGTVVFLRQFGRSGELRAAEKGGARSSGRGGGPAARGAREHRRAEPPRRRAAGPAADGSQLVHVAAVSDRVVGRDPFAMTAARPPRVAPVAGPAVSARVMAWCFGCSCPSRS